MRAYNFLKGKPASVVTRQDIRAFAEALQQGDIRANPKGRALAAKSINDNCLIALSNVYSLAMKEEILSSDPTKGISVKASVAESRPIQAYTREQVVAILQSTRFPKRQRVKQATANIRRWAPWLCSFTGARISEVLWLRKRAIIERNSNASASLQVCRHHSLEQKRAIPLQLCNMRTDHCLGLAGGH